MGREFEQRREVEVDATPQQVWDAVATGPGLDSWLMGRSEVEPGEGGTVRTDLGGFVMESKVTAWEPSKRFAYRGIEAENGRFIAYEFLIEGRDGDGKRSVAVAANSLAAIDPSGERVVADVPVGGTPTAISAGEGALWVLNADDQTVSRVDLATHAVKTFGSGGVPVDLAVGETLQPSLFQIFTFSQQ